MKRSYVSATFGLVCIFSFFFCAEIIPIKILSYEHTIYIGRDEIVPVGKTVTAVVNDTLCFLVATNQPEKVEEISIELTSKYVDAPVLLSVTSKNSADSLWSIGCYPCNQSDTITAILSITYQSVTRRDTLTIMVTGGVIGSKPVIGNNNAILTFGEVAIGQQLGLYVDATGEGVLQYQWKKDTTLLSGATDDTLVIRSLTPADTGWYQCLVSNDFGTQGSDSMHVQLTAITNHPPQWLQDTLRFSIREDSLLAVDLAALCFDVDSTTLLFSLNEGAPAGDTLVDAHYSWRPGFDAAGEHAITITASDGVLKTPGVLAVTVTNTNRAPQFEPDSPKIAYLIDEGAGLVIPCAATDPDGDVVTYRVISSDLPGAPVELDTAARCLRWQSQVNQSGTYGVTLGAYDGQDSILIAITIGVGNVNLPPVIRVAHLAGTVIAAGDTLRVAENQQLALSVSVTDPNSADTPALLTAQNLPAGATLDTGTGQFFYTPDFSVATQKSPQVILPVELTATDFNDTNGAATFRCFFKVVNVNRSPAFVTDTPQVTYQINELDLLSIPFKAVDPDSDTLSYSLGATTLPRPQTLVLNAATGIVQWQSQLQDNGVATLEILADDGDTAVIKTVTVTILKVNLPPEIRVNNSNTANAFSISEQKTLTLAVSVIDPNPGDQPVLLAARNAPAGSVYDTTTGIFAYTPDFNVSSAVNNVTFNVEFLARDNAVENPQADTFRLAITVLDSNRAPSAVSDSASTLEDASVMVNVLANDTDPDTDALTILSVINGKLGTASVVTNSIRYVPAEDSNGVDTIAYTMRDAGGMTATAQVYVTIIPVNDPPSFDKGEDVVVVDSFGVFTIPGWARNISGGPADEFDPMMFYLTTLSDTGSILDAGVAMSATGDLNYMIAQGKSGTATVRAVLKDMGGTENGGVDSSVAQIFTITAINIPANSLVAHWSFDAIVNDTLFPDSTGNNFNIVGSGISLTQGKKGSALNCPGSGFDLAVENSVNAFKLDEFSIEAWIKTNVDPAVHGQQQKIFDFQYIASGVRNGYSLYIHQSGAIGLGMANATGTGWIELNTNTTIVQDVWYHVVVSYGSDGIKLYINGSLDNSLTYANGYPAPGQNARIGCQRLQSGQVWTYLNGNIDEMKFFRSILPAEIVSKRYSAMTK